MSFGVEKEYHIGLCAEDIEGAKYAILPGDPGRVEKIAEMLEDAKYLTTHREYVSYLGTLAGEKVLVMSTGMGGPSTAIGVEELVHLGVDTMIRVGTCGGMDLDVMAGDVIVITGAIRQEGTSKEYVPVEYPAIADLDVTLALREAAKESGFGWKVGVAHCKDNFYGQHSPMTMPIGDELAFKWNAWIKAGALISEMETAALYTVASVRRVRAGAVMLCMWNQERAAAGLPQERCFDNTRSITVAVKAIEKLIAQDKSS